ncbi:M12 family metallopeptidase [Arthrobacter sp. GCM10027362]|uniref:M12 family metallopeptidase n=1 Tax=Arthrobacter sp. GCM10027362 TaxID=3273379 RepID=UPI00363290B7
MLLPVLLLPACSNTPRPAAPENCQTPAGSMQLDIDPEDTPEAPWPKPAGRELEVYFDTSGLSARYAKLASEAARIWSRSPCLNAHAAECPSGANCVAVEEEFSRGRNTDGEFTGHNSDGVREGGTITLYTRLLDEASDNGALGTIVHEMGHALGLVHRQDRNDVMNSVTDDQTNPVPDGTDFYNLAVIYGAGA